MDEARKLQLHREHLSEERPDSLEPISLALAPECKPHAPISGNFDVDSIITNKVCSDSPLARIQFGSALQHPKGVETSLPVAIAIPFEKAYADSNNLLVAAVLPVEKVHVVPKILPVAKVASADKAHVAPKMLPVATAVPIEKAQVVLRSDTWAVPENQESANPLGTSKFDIELAVPRAAVAVPQQHVMPVSASTHGVQDGVGHHETQGAFHNFATFQSMNLPPASGGGHTGCSGMSQVHCSGLNVLDVGQQKAWSVPSKVQNVVDNLPPLIDRSDTETLSFMEMEEATKWRKAWAARGVALHVFKMISFFWMGYSPPDHSWDRLKQFKRFVTVVSGQFVLILTIRYWARLTYHPMTSVNDFCILWTGKPLDKRPPEIKGFTIVSMVWLGIFESILPIFNYVTTCWTCFQESCEWVSYAQLGLSTLTIIFTIKRFVLTCWFAFEVWTVMLVIGICTAPCACIGCCAVPLYLCVAGFQRDTVFCGQKCASVYDNIAWFYTRL